MKVEFLIATMDRKDASFLDNMFHKVGLDNVHAVVINQITTIDMPRNFPTPHSGIRVFSINETGLAKSRNMALKYSKGDILVIADDDVVYEKDAIESIKKHHSICPVADILTFKGIGTAKQYSTQTRSHNVRSILRVSSCEITLKKEVITKRIWFDERFGLGAPYPIGEENIWLLDALRAGINIFFTPKNIVTHKGISTGKRYNAVNEQAKGAMLARMYGLFAIPLYGWFAIKKYRAFSKKHSLLAEVYYLFFGGCRFLFTSLYKH